MEDWAATTRLVEDEVNSWVDWEGGGKGGVLIRLGEESSEEDSGVVVEAYMTNILSTISLVEEEVGSKLAGSSSNNGLKVVVVSSSNSKPNFLINRLIHAD